MDVMPAEGTGLPGVGDEIAGKYRVESVLGQGGMGAVFAARNAMTGKRVAIKWLLPEHAASVTRERLLREAQLASSIDHPNVVDIYDVGEHQGGLFLVMEYLRGRPLSDVLAARGRLDPDELIALLVPAMRGVHAAHLAGVIHRDLKPENIILSEIDGQIVPKVVDFGVSKTIGESALPSPSLTRTGALVGTPHYMALEQVDGSNAIDPRTDVYAFGVLIYRSLTGHYPFDGSSLGEVILKIGTREAAPMRMLRPELPAALDAAVLRALSRERHKRFKDLEEYARALMHAAGRRVVEGEEATSAHGLAPGAVSFRSLGIQSISDATGPDPSPSVAQPTAPANGRTGRRRAALAAAVMVLVLLAAGVLLTRREVTNARVETSAPSSSPPPAAASSAALPMGALAPMPVAPAAEPPLALEAPEQPVDPGVLDLESGTGEGAAGSPQSGDSKAASAAKASTRSVEASAAVNGKTATRTKHVRPVPATARKSGVPALIPGERTNGLSVDEF